MPAECPTASRHCEIALTGISKQFGAVTAVKSLSLQVNRGEFLTILGPSGSGKTTTLHMIAGFTFPSEGSIRYRGIDITYTPAHLRNIGMVFQNYVLFPHMTVWQNVAFPLRMRRVSRERAQREVEGVLDLVGLRGLESRRPAELSGGQQQRAALARALVYRPSLLLMDEPLGALDKHLKERMQAEIKRIQRTLGTTIVYVTHDQHEALAMSDRIAVMADGKLHSLGSPEEIYEHPDNRFIAEFVGESNFLKGSIVDVAGSHYQVRIADDVLVALEKRGTTLRVGDSATFCVRPESIEFADEGCYFQAVVEDVAFLGDAYRFELVAPASSRPVRIVCRRQRIAAVPMPQRSHRIGIRWNPSAAWILAEPSAPNNGGEKQ